MRSAWFGMVFAVAAVALAALLCRVPAAGAVGVNPWRHWQTLESTHFRITFPAGKEALARRALAIAESVRQELDPRFGWDPAGKVELVLTDYMDLPNGATTALPYNHIELFIAPPDGLDYSLEDFDDWLRLLITHEYTHVLQMDKASGVPRVMRHVFGRFPLLFPGIFQPTMMLEGLAVYDETDTARGIGRGQGAQFGMMMRVEVDRGVRPYDQVTMSGVSLWPDGTLPYLYGVNFYQYIAQRYGEPTIYGLVDNYSHQIVPFLTNMNLDHVLDADDVEDIWQDFGQYLHAHYQATPGVPADTPLVHGVRLSHFGYGTSAPVVATDGSVYFIRDGAYRAPAIMRWRDGIITPVADIDTTPARLDWNAHAGLLLARPEICNDYDYYFDLFRIEPDSGRVTRLTRCARYHYAAWSPDGREIVAVQQAGAQASLVLLDAQGHLQTTLWKAKDGTLLSGLDWSPQGHRLVAAVWRRHRGWAIELFDLDSRRWQVLTTQKDAGQPRFSPDGQAVLFTSAQGGVFNLRRIKLDGSASITLTRVRTGAFYPAPASNGDVYYIGYGAEGFDLYQLPAAQALAVPVVIHPIPQLPPRTPVKPVVTGAVHPYSPWRSLMPRYWFPELNVGPDQVLIGASTSGQDSLGIHNYSADLYHELRHDLTGADFIYSFSDRFSFAFGRGYDFFNSSDGKTLERIRRNDQIEATAAMPLLDSSAHALWLDAGLHREHDRDVYFDTASSANAVPAYSSTLAGIRLLWNSAKHWPVSISPNDGRELQLIAETGRDLPGDFPGNAWRFDWNEYLRTGNESVLHLRYVEGYATRDAEAYSLGGPHDAGTGTLLQDFVFGQRGFALRGYAEGQFSGHRLRIEGLAWQFPILHLERGFITVPFGLHQLSGQVFLERGAAWEQGGAPARYYNSIGMEADADLNLLYIVNFTLGVGVAHGMSAGGENQVYATLTLPY